MSDLYKDKAEQNLQQFKKIVPHPTAEQHLILAQIYATLDLADSNRWIAYFMERKV